MTTLTCPSCKKQLRMPEGRTIRKLKCPFCNVTFDAGIEIESATAPMAKPAPAVVAELDPSERRHGRRRGRGNLDVFVPEENKNIGRLFGAELWSAIGLLAICIPLVILSFCGPNGANVGYWGLWLVLCAFGLWGGFWLLGIAFEEDMVQGLLCLFIPFYQLYYVITRFGECYRALAVQLAGILVIPFLVVAAAQLARNAPAQWAAAHAGNAARADAGVERAVERAPEVPTTPPAKHLAKDRNDPQFIDLCLEDLRSNDPKHRAQAAGALATVRPSDERRRDVIKALEAVADDPEKAVRAPVVKAIGTWGGKDQLPMILKALKDENPQVVNNAADAAARLKDERAIEPMIEALGNPGGEVAQALRSFGPAVEKPLINAMKHPKALVRQNAASLLGDMDSAAAATAMLDALRDSDAQVQGAAIRYFTRHPDERAVAGLVSCLTQASLNHRDAIAALRAIGAPAEKAVLPLLDGKDYYHVKGEILKLLADIGTKESVPALREVAIKDDNGAPAAKDALRAIAQRYPNDFPADAKIDQVDALTQALARLKSDDPFKCQDALKALQEMEPIAERRSEVIKAIERLLEKEHLLGIESAVQVLAVWGGKDATPTLTKLLTASNPHVRKAVLNALVKTKDDRAIPAIAARMLDFFDHNAACEALKEFGVAAQVEVSKYCEHRDKGTRLDATKLLGMIGDQKSIPLLQKLANQKVDRDLAATASFALKDVRARVASEEANKEKEKENKDKPPDKSKSP